MRAPESMEELLLAWRGTAGRTIAKRLVHKGFAKKLGTEPEIVVYLPTDNGCRMMNECGHYVYTLELETRADAQRYTKVTVHNKNRDGSWIVHFEDDTDKDKLTAEQVASLVSDPNYVGLDITLKEPISKKTRAKIQENPVPGEGAIELGHDTDVFGVVLVEKNGTVRKAVHQVTRAQIAKIYPPAPADGAGSAEIVSNGVGEGEAVLPVSVLPEPAAARRAAKSAKAAPAHPRRTGRKEAVQSDVHGAPPAKADRKRRAGRLVDSEDESPPYQRLRASADLD